VKRYITLIFSIFIISYVTNGCGKDIEGPSTLGPQTIDSITPIDYGSLNIYLGWRDHANYCDSIPVLIDDSIVGHLSLFFTDEPNCNEKGTVTLDNLVIGTHQIYVGDCDFIFWEMDMVVVKDVCISVPIHN